MDMTDISQMSTGNRKWTLLALSFSLIKISRQPFIKPTNIFQVLRVDRTNYNCIVVYGIVEIFLQFIVSLYILRRLIKSSTLLYRSSTLIIFENFSGFLNIWHQWNRTAFQRFKYRLRHWVKSSTLLYRSTTLINFENYLILQTLYQQNKTASQRFEY